MAKNKEMEFYVNGMQHAYNVLKQGGIEELQRELQYRASNPLPMNVSRQELTALARARAKEELMFVATSMATTLTKDIKLPPMMVKEFLVKFNDRIDVYRMDKEQYEVDQSKLDNDYLLNQMVRDYLEEEKKDAR